MPDTELPIAAYADHPIWVALDNYSIGPADAALPFAARLARENSWTEAKAERVIVEYKRFCFLAATAEAEMTPSDAVDQAWHLHLAYSRDYWERFCPNVLGRPLHHGPTAGRSDDRHRYFEQYAQTLKRYQEVFGAPAPADLWPAAAQRLIEDPRARRLHPRDGYFITRPQAALALLLAAALSIVHIIFW